MVLRPVVHTGSTQVIAGARSVLMVDFHGLPCFPLSRFLDRVEEYRVEWSVFGALDIALSGTSGLGQVATR